MGTGVTESLARSIREQYRRDTEALLTLGARDVAHASALSVLALGDAEVEISLDRAALSRSRFEAGGSVTLSAASPQMSDSREEWEKGTKGAGIGLGLPQAKEVCVCPRVPTRWCHV